MLVREQAAGWASRSGSATAIRVGVVLFAAALTAAAGRFSLTLPFTPVPITLQPIVVLAGAAVLGARLGMLGQVSFLAAGLTGLPVFADSAVLPPGPLRFLGPTGGYLLSYPIAAFVTGALLTRAARPTALGATVAMSAGLGVIYTVGALWIAGWSVMVTGAGISHALTTAVATGLAPFVALDLVKVIVAAQFVPFMRRRIRLR
jgi:biotin transport system substrate-specific component